MKQSKILLRRIKFRQEDIEEEIRDIDKAISRHIERKNNYSEYDYHKKYTQFLKKKELLSCEYEAISKIKRKYQD